VAATDAKAASRGGTGAAPNLSAGILAFRRRRDSLEFFLVHPGGPFWARKDDGAWSIPKGEYSEGEHPLEAARREFSEETGFTALGPFTKLATLRQPSGKLISAWAMEGEFDPVALRSNTFAMEWPPRSGKQAQFPEVDRAGWFGAAEAKRKLIRGQVGFIDELSRLQRSRQD
jgi:predicted NUDIX family NTP pyrophosphohydrolase